jgi:putative PIN family toxin of toxin-antitoxin system
LIVVIDASTFVSAALKASSLPERALLRAVEPSNRLILSPEVEDEYREVIFRPKFDRFVSVERRQPILDIVLVAAERIEPTVTLQECRDPKDDKYLALAFAGKAEVIVSSDARHLRSMHPGAGFPFCLQPIFSLFGDLRLSRLLAEFWMIEPGNRVPRPLGLSGLSQARSTAVWENSCDNTQHRGSAADSRQPRRGRR